MLGRASACLNIMPFSRKYSKKKKSYKKKKSSKIAVRSRAKYVPITTAGWITPSKTVRFTFTRNYTVEETAASDLVLAVFIANSPYLPQSSVQGDWTLQNGNSSDNCLGLSEWVAQNAALLGGTYKYREGNVISSTISVTAIPMQQSGSTSDTYQDFTQLAIHIGTGGSDYNSLHTSSTVNASTIANQPFTSVAQTATNANGTPRGATVSAKYSFKDFNSASTKSEAAVSSTV